MEKKKEAVAVSSAAAEVTAVTPKVKRRSIVEFISDTLSPPEKTKTKTAVKTGKEEKKKGETDGDNTKVKKKKKKKKRRSIVEVVAGTIKSAVAAAEERSAREKAADRITIEAELRAKLLKRHDSMNGELSSSKKKKKKKSKKKKNRKAVLRNTHTKKDTRKTQLQEREADAEGVEERAAAAGAQKGKRDPNATASLVETAAQLGSLTAELLPADSDVTQSAWSDSE